MKISLVLSILCLSFFCSVNVNGEICGNSRLYGKAKFENNIIKLQIFNESDSDAYILDSYFKQGWSNSKWFYRWNKSKNLLKVSYVPLAYHLSLRPSDLVLFPSSQVIDKNLNNSDGRIQTYMNFDTIPSHSSKVYEIVSQNFKNIEEVLIDCDSISLYNITKFKFAHLKQKKNQEWYIELALYNSILYLDRRNKFVEQKLYQQLFDYIPLIIKIEMD